MSALVFTVSMPATCASSSGSGACPKLSSLGTRPSSDAWRRAEDVRANASEDLESAAAVDLIEAESIDTNQSARDDDLRSPRLFDTATYPQIRFASRRIEHVKDGTFRILGDLTIKKTTRELELEALLGLGAVRRSVRRSEGFLEPLGFGDERLAG